MEQLNPYEALTQSNEGSFSDEALQNNAALLGQTQEKQQQEQELLEESAAGPSATAMNAEQQIEQVHQQEEKETQDGLEKYVETAQDVGQNVLEFTDTAREFVNSPAAGTIDFAIDAFNLTPANFPKLPEFENDIAQGFREIASVVIPTFLLTKLGIAGGVASQARVGWAIGRDPLVKLFSVMGLEAGVGAAVDYTSSTSKDGHNATGAMKKYLPELFWWIPDDIATLDDDSPDIKRDKSVKEGAALGPFTDLLLGASRIARGIRGNHKIRGQFIPEDETSKGFYEARRKSEAKTKALVKAKTGQQMLEALNPEFTITDTRGKEKFFHGAAQEFELVEGGQYAGSKNIYGSGLYVTDDFQTASSYKPKNRDKGVKKADAAEQGVVYEVDMSKQNLFDLDGPARQDFIDFLKEEKYDAMDELIERAVADTTIDSAKRGVMPTTAEFMDNMRGYSRSLEVPSYEITEVFEQYQDMLKAKGFTGFKHVGGKKAGKGKRLHQVAVIFDPFGTSAISKTNPDDYKNFKEQVVYEEAKEAVEASAKARQDGMDELGRYNSSADKSLDQPMLGIDNDMYEATEQGIRSVDPNGVHGAAVDAARIANNKNTVYGRMGSIISEGALKHGLEAGSITQRTFIKQIKESLAAGGKYSYKDAVGSLTTSKQIEDAGDALAAVLFDPRMSTQMMKAILEENKNVMEGLQVLDKAGYQGVFKAIKLYKDDFFNLDTLKAQAYLTHSLGGQVSDMAEGMRLMDGTDAIERVQEQIIDRITYLTAEKGLASKLAGSNLRNMNMWKRIRSMGKKEANEAAEGITEDLKDSVANVVERARRYRDVLNNIRKSRPEFLKPLMQVNELTDGNVDSMYKLNEWVSNKLGTVEKAFIDGKPEIPSEVIKGAYGNLYNSLLSAVATPAKAGFGNAALLLEKPVATMIGALASKDVQSFRKAWYMYSAVGETFLKGMNHMGMVFAKASRNPNNVPYMVRDNIATRQADEMAGLRLSADAYAENGNDGPAIMVDVAESLFDLQNHPVLRWGTNALSALDGFNRAVIANGEARGMAYTNMLESGVKVDGKALKSAADDYYSKMFDKDGFIADKAVDYMSRETTMSLDNPIVDGISVLTTHLPALKPWLLFSRTPVNILGQFWNRSAASALAGDYNKIVGLPGKVHSIQEIEEILKSRQIPNDEFALQRFKSLQHEIKGRVALGQVAVGAATFMFMNDRITGTGHYDKERQNNRREMGWQPKSIKGLDGKYYSYAEIGPLADWLATTVDVMDNFDLISTASYEDFSRKMGFILGGAFVNRSTLQGLQPLMDVLSGNPASWMRWASTTASGFVPLSGLRNTIGQVMYPDLKVLDEEFGQHLRNRNKYLDVVDPKGALPTQYDWVDGTPINYVEGFWERLVNATLPVKIKDTPSPLRQFLIDIEYDARPTFAKSSGGIKLNNVQRAELFSLMGQNPYLRQELNKIKKDAEAIDFVGQLRKARREMRGNDDVIIEKFASIYSRVDKVIREAKEIAEESISDLDDIRSQEMELDMNIQQNQYGIIQNK